ncbi:MAG: hypothetical protein IJZ55_04640 [Lachnospiraceae bacterium]|nr:hypothetical protein [Lachnospiraceae bacterium]
MKKKKLLCGIGVAVLVAGAFFTGHTAGAASKTPGSTGDPLVTLSYLEERLGVAQGGARKVQLSRGDVLNGKPGTGIVVLGVSVTATGSGLVDVTEGAFAEADTSLFPYHSYIAAEESSGCEALSTCTVLVSGEYTVKKNNN